jgi:uncharacterized flavoprotein (TIGR03862 family)
VDRLRNLGVTFAMNHRWTGFSSAPRTQLRFENGARFTADAVIFALGGGSWPRTGSDGQWAASFTQLGISVEPLVPANCGWEHPWPPEVLAAAEGQPLKNLRVEAGNTSAVGELLVTRYGLEGGALYQLGAILRAMAEPAIAIDFKPTFSHTELLAKMASARRNFLDEAGRRWKLSEAARAILAARQDWADADRLAREVKHCVLKLVRPRPLEEAISSAGGVAWSALDQRLMLRKRPGVFLAGEMIDWEAPTGGYLLHGCLASGTRAGASAADWLKQPHTSPVTGFPL